MPIASVPSERTGIRALRKSISGSIGLVIVWMSLRTGLTMSLKKVPRVIEAWSRLTVGAGLFVVVNGQWTLRSDARPGNCASAPSAMCTWTSALPLSVNVGRR